MTRRRLHITGIFARLSLGKLTAIACVCLLAIFTTAAVAHTHAAVGPEDTAHCSLCVAAHHSAATLTQPAVAAVVFAHFSAPIAEQHPAPRSAFLRTHDSRPPPTC